MLCGLVLLMRATLDQGALGMRGYGNQRYRAILLETIQFEAALDTELSRAGRHERPLSVVLLEVVGSVPETEGRQRRSAFAAIARSIVERIRIEDSVGHLGGMRFALIAPETTSGGVAAMAATVAGRCVTGWSWPGSIRTPSTSSRGGRSSRTAPPTVRDS